MKELPDNTIFELVEASYDKIAEIYSKERTKFGGLDCIDELCALLPDAARVLDAGCGSGIPVAAYLSEKGYDVVGIDLSPAMIELAKCNVPEAEFRQMNMTELDFAAGTFDGIVSCYAIFHIPRKLHAAVFASFYELLKPGGVMLVSVGCSDWEEVEGFHGVEMYWSHFPAAQSRELIASAGFSIEFSKDIESGGETHHWILTRKPTS